MRLPLNQAPLTWRLCLVLPCRRQRHLRRATVAVCTRRLSGATCLCTVGCTRASDDGGLLPSRFPTLSVTAAISDTERRKKFNSLIKFGGEDAQDESVPEGEDPGQLRSAGFLELNHFLCDGKEFRDLSYCSNKKYLAGVPPTEPSGRNIGYFQANVGTMETGILAANALRNLLVSNGTHGLL